MKTAESLLDRLFMKLVDEISCRWCPICNAGRPLMPGEIVIECWNCGVAIHCDNWNTAKQKDKPTLVP
jgi:hypothetical protein